MALSRNPLGGILLVAGVALAAAVFGGLNWHWLEERRQLDKEGIAAVGHIDAVTISHKACNSSIRVSWADAGAARHAGRFMTCFANRSAGQAIAIRYLPQQPDIAMIAEGEGGLPDEQYRTGMRIGLIVAAVMGAVAVHLVMRRRSETGV